MKQSVFERRPAVAPARKVKKYLLIDLYNGDSSFMSEEEAQEWIEGQKPNKGAKNVWQFEESMVIELDS